jgi:molybdenum cofactor cytidylyltransferase
MDKVWGIILAAGASTRMGKQKMLLPFAGKTIIEAVIETAIPTLESNILVVLGSHRNEIRTQICKLPVRMCENENYKEGMLSSVICGLKNIPHDAEGVMIFLGDQPHIPAIVVNEVTEVAKQNNKGIVIPTFDGKRGHPVFIDLKYRKEIERLNPNKGLRELMLNNGKDIMEIECDKQEILRDIDTPHDYEKEMNNIQLK